MVVSSVVDSVVKDVAGGKLVGILDNVTMTGILKVRLAGKTAKKRKMSNVSIRGNKLT